jgi:prepilin-type N-terminal cleavage/methylation domain-containing protein
MRRRHARRGFTLVEVIVSIALLAGVMLGFATFTQRMAHGSSVASQRSSESDLAVDRLETIKALTDYSAIDAYAVTEPSITGYPGLSRQTYVRRTQSTAADHKTVTVVVRQTTLGDSVVKSTVISAF